MSPYSDRGSQYTSEQFRRLMADSGIVCELIQKFPCNEAMESFFSWPKTERIELETCRVKNEARAGVFGYIEQSRSR